MTTEELIILNYGAKANIPQEDLKSMLQDARVMDEKVKTMISLTLSAPSQFQE